MRLAQGPRPWSITLFALLFAGAAAVTLASSLMHLDRQVALLARDWPAIATRDGAIILASARCTISLIPVALIWLLASRAARWLVLAMSLAKLVARPQALADSSANGASILVIAAPLIVSLIGVALLFTPGAAQWLRPKGSRDATVFS